MLDFVLCGLATWRVSHIVLYENGPWEMFARARKALGVEYHNNVAVSYKYEITVCLWCLSVWVGLVWALLLWLVPNVAVWLSLPFVFSTAAIAVDHTIGNRKD